MAFLKISLISTAIYILMAIVTYVLLTVMELKEYGERRSTSGLDMLSYLL